MSSNFPEGRIKLLITGATGFVAQKLIQQLVERKEYLVSLTSRSLMTDLLLYDELFCIEEISDTTNWHDALENCEVVIHLAARVHVMDESAENPLDEFRQVNVQGTLNLARQAAAQGVKRFIFISSIKVNGEETPLGQPYRPDDFPAPQEPYAISKYEAEQGLLALSQETGMEFVIIRPTIIYGAGVKGNFQQMMAYVERRYPFPLKTIKNKRSFVSVYNLVDLIITCITHPRAANQIFLVSDGEDVSIGKLLKFIGTAMNKDVLLLPFPHWLLRMSAKVTGKQIIVQRLCGSLQVDMSKTCELLDWRHKLSLLEGLKKALLTNESK